MPTRLQISVCLGLIGLLLLIVFAVPGDQAVAIRTLGLGLGTCAVALPLGVVIGWACYSGSWVARILLFVCIGLLFVPLFMHVAAWDSAFGKLGWISSQNKTLTPMFGSWAAAIWIHAMAAAPQIGLIIYIGRRASGRIQDEQALLDAGRGTVFWSVTFPRLIPLMSIALVWVFIVCCREIAVTDIYQIGTLAEQIYVGYSLGELGSIVGNWTPQQLAAAQSTNWLMTVAIIFCLCTAALFAGQRFATELTGSHELDSQKDRLRPSSRARNLVGLFLIALIAVVPISNLVMRASFFVKFVDGIPTPGFSAASFWRSIARVPEFYGVEFQWSASIALATCALLLVATIAAVWITRNSRSGQFILLLSVAIACAIPGPLIGVGVVKIFSSFDSSLMVWIYDRTIFPAVVATFVSCWPLTTIFVWFVMGNTARDTIENSMLEGAGSFSQLVYLTVAQNWPALTGCFLISWSICFGELSASQITLPPGMDTVPRLTLGLLHAGVNEMTAAITIVSIALIVAISVIGCLLAGLHRPAIRGK